MNGCKQMLTATSTNGQAEPARPGPLQQSVLDERLRRSGDRGGRMLGPVVERPGARRPERAQGFHHFTAHLAWASFERGLGPAGSPAGPAAGAETTVRSERALATSRLR